MKTLYDCYHKGETVYVVYNYKGILPKLIRTKNFNERSICHGVEEFKFISRSTYNHSNHFYGYVNGNTGKYVNYVEDFDINLKTDIDHCSMLSPSKTIVCFFIERRSTNSIREYSYYDCDYVTSYRSCLYDDSQREANETKYVYRRRDDIDVDYIDNKYIIKQLNKTSINITGYDINYKVFVDKEEAEEYSKGMDKYISNYISKFLKNKKKSSIEKLSIDKEEYRSNIGKFVKYKSGYLYIYDFKEHDKGDYYEGWYLIDDRVYSRETLDAYTVYSSQKKMKDRSAWKTVDINTVASGACWRLFGFIKKLKEFNNDSI